MPVSPLYDHPAALYLPAAGFGMVTRLCLHFWATDCRPLPTDDSSLMQIARAHRPTWRHWKSEIMAILADMLPELQAAKAQRDARKSNLIAAQYASIAARKAARLAASNAPPALPVHAMPHIPRKEPPKPQRLPSKATRRLTD